MDEGEADGRVSMGEPNQSWLGGIGAGGLGGGGGDAGCIVNVIQTAAGQDAARRPFFGG